MDDGRVQVGCVYLIFAICIGLLAYFFAQVIFPNAPITETIRINAQSADWLQRLLFGPLAFLADTPSWGAVIAGLVWPIALIYFAVWLIAVAGSLSPILVVIGIAIFAIILFGGFIQGEFG
jgi:hypothetical protein